jgi:hypothetical protein
MPNHVALFFNYAVSADEIRYSKELGTSNDEGKYQGKKGYIKILYFVRRTTKNDDC